MCHITSPEANQHSWPLAYQSVIGSSGLSDVASGKTDGLKWRVGEPVR